MEDDWAQELGAVLEKVTSLEPAYNRAYDARAQDNSVRRADDIATGPLAIGEHITYAIAQAVDTCVGTRDLVYREGQGLILPLASTYPLGRSAIESAGAAVWLMRPTDRRTRVLRRLQLAHTESAFERSLVATIASTRDPKGKAEMERVAAKDHRRHRGYMKRIANVNEIDPVEYTNTFPGWEALIADASIAVGDQPQMIVAAWKFASGLTHPSFMRGTIAHEFISDSGDEGRFKGLVRARTDWVTAIAHTAVTMTETALRLYRHSKIQVNAERPVPRP